MSLQSDSVAKGLGAAQTGQAYSTAQQSARLSGTVRMAGNAFGHVIAPSIDGAIDREPYQNLRCGAVMRKMITTLNAMVRDDIVWADRSTGRHNVPTAR